MGQDKNPKTKAARGVIATKAAYKKERYEALDRISLLNIDLPEILDSEIILGTRKDKFRASIVLDRKNKKIIYAIAGTRINQGYQNRNADLKDDAKLALRLNPSKLKSLIEFNSFLIDEVMGAAEEGYKRKIASENIKGFDDENLERQKLLIKQHGFNKSDLAKARAKALEGYEIDFSGHSLGAVLADCAAADMHLQLESRSVNPEYCKISSITFDNPGAITPVKKICNKANKSLSEVRSTIDYKAFNNRDNFINTMDQQVGEKYQIIPDGQKARSGFANMCAWIAKKLPLPVIKHVFKFLSFGRIGKQMEEHSLSNFDNVLVQGLGVVKGKDGTVMTMEEASTGTEPLEYNRELFDNISSTQALDKAKFSMTNPDGERVEFSKAQLKEAYEAVQSEKKLPKSFITGFASKISTKSFSKFKKQEDMPGKYEHSKAHKKRSAEQVLLKDISRKIQ